MSFEVAWPSLEATCLSRVRATNLVWPLAGCQMPGHFSIFNSTRIFSDWLSLSAVGLFKLRRRGDILRASGSPVVKAGVIFSTAVVFSFIMGFNLHTPMARYQPTLVSPAVCGI